MIAYISMASMVAQKVKNLRAVQETRVPSLSQEDLLEKGIAIHSGILAWRIPWTEEPGGLHKLSLCSLTEWLTRSLFSLFIGSRG